MDIARAAPCPRRFFVISASPHAARLKGNLLKEND
jgi:hypothetical protein